jgi:hypothetical protein
MLFVVNGEKQVQIQQFKWLDGGVGKNQLFELIVTWYW